MEKKSSSRRLFVGAITALTAANSFSFSSSPEADIDGAQRFVSAWDMAWANHDAQALGSLHTENAITVNRFGTVVDGRVAIQKALAFLHQNNGPFSHSSVPPQQIFSVQQIADNVMTIHTKWQSPVMNPDGKIDPTKIDDMIVTFVVQRTGHEWKAVGVDLHNVEKMDLPFSNPTQRH
jgi:ketosteroid isomerase-like protein